MWVEFVFGSRLCSERFFSGYSGFPLSSKTNTSKFKLDPESVPNKCSALNTLTLKLSDFFILLLLLLLLLIIIIIIIILANEVFGESNVQSLVKPIYSNLRGLNLRKVSLIYEIESIASIHEI